MTADNTARCILDNFPRTTATKSPSWIRKGKHSGALHIPKTQAVLTQCNQPYGPLSPNHKLCPGNFCLFLVRDRNDWSASKYCSGLSQSWFFCRIIEYSKFRHSLIVLWPSYIVAPKTAHSARAKATQVQSQAEQSLPLTGYQCCAWCTPGYGRLLSTPLPYSHEKLQAPWSPEAHFSQVLGLIRCME